jgi:hypothetical protein
MLRFIGALLIGLAVLLSLPALGAVGGWFGGFYLVGVPEGPNCGLAALPAIMAGGLGALLGLAGGGILGMIVFEAILEQQSFELDDAADSLPR